MCRIEYHKEKTDREKLLCIHLLKAEIESYEICIEKEIRKIGVFTNSKYYAKFEDQKLSYDRVILGCIEDLQYLYVRADDMRQDFSILTSLLHGHAIAPEKYQVDPNVRVNLRSYVNRVTYQEPKKED